MRPVRTRSYSLRPIAAVLLVVSLQAGTKWSLVPEPKTLGTHPYSTVRVTLVGAAKHLVVKHPTVVGDSITWSSPERGSVALSQVAWVEARVLDGIATGFFALVGATFVFVGTVLH